MWPPKTKIPNGMATRLQATVIADKHLTSRFVGAEVAPAKRIVKSFVFFID